MREFKVISGLLHMSLTYYRVIGDSESVVGEVKKEGESESERGETDETTESEESLSPRKDTKADMQDYVQRFLMQSENIEFWWKLSFWEDLFYGTYLPPPPPIWRFLFFLFLFRFLFLSPFPVPFPLSFLDSIVEECARLFGKMEEWKKKETLSPSEMEEQKELLYQQKNYYFGQLGSYGKQIHAKQK